MVTKLEEVRVWLRTDNAENITILYQEEREEMEGSIAWLAIAAAVKSMKNVTFQGVMNFLHNSLNSLGKTLDV